MIDLYTMEETFAYDLYHITKAFFPEEEFRQHVEAKQGMLVVIEKEGERLLSIGPEELDGLVEKKEKKMRINHRIYKALVDYQGNGLSWGILTGIRPTKVVMKQLEEGKQKKKSRRCFRIRTF